MKNKIEKFSINKTQFILELFSMPIDYHITVGEMKELNDCIIEEAEPWPNSDREGRCVLPKKTMVHRSD